MGYIHPVYRLIVCVTLAIMLYLFSLFAIGYLGFDSRSRKRDNTP